MTKLRSPRCDGESLAVDFNQAIMRRFGPEGAPCEDVVVAAAAILSGYLAAHPDPARRRELLELIVDDLAASVKRSLS